MRVQSPDPTTNGGNYNIDFAFGLSAWSAEPGQPVSAFFVVWDVDTGARLQFGQLVTGTAPYSPLFTTTTHSVQLGPVTTSGPRRIRISIHPGSNQSANLGGFALLRYVALSVAVQSDPTGGALVDGAFSNQGWHRGQDLLDATRDTNRYRVTLGSVAPLADDPAQLLTVGGVVRLRSDRLTVDKRFRVARLVWSLKDDDAVELELASLTPRLTEST
jgi:hypothetical protein